MEVSYRCLTGNARVKGYEAAPSSAKRKLPNWFRVVLRKQRDWLHGGAPANISSVSPATGLVGTQATITGSGFGVQGASQVQIGTQPLTVNTGAIPASSPRLPLALQLGTSLSPREPNIAMLFSFT